MKANENRIQTEDLIKRYRQNDQKAFNELLQMYEPLVLAEVTRHTEGNDWYDYDDFRQVAQIAFSNAVLNFDLLQDEVEFGLFAKICISNALISYRRLIDRINGNLVDLDPTSVQPTWDLDDPAVLIAAEDAARLLLARIRKMLSPYENRVWNLYMAGHSAKEIARVVEKDAHSIENAVYRIRRKLRQGLGKGD